MKLKVASTLYRTATFERTEADSNKLRLSISSDDPYKRFDWDEGEYWEVLDHGPGGIADERLKAGMPLLYNHDRDVVLGRSEGYECDGHKCFVEPTLSGAEDVSSHVAKIKEGTLRDTSVGYEVIGKGVEIGKKEGLPVYKFKFRPFEASIVSIPADITVGVGRMRDLEKKTEPKEIEIEPKKDVDETLKSENNNSQQRDKSQKRENTMETETLPKPDTKEIETKASETATANERKRVKDIQELSRHFREKGLAGRKIDTSVEAEKHIADGKTVGEFQSFVMVNEFKDVQPLETPEQADLNGRAKGEDSGIRVVGERTQSFKSLGEAFVASGEYKRVQKLRAAGHRVMALEFDGLTNFRANFTTSGSITGFNGIVQIPNIYEIGVQRPTVADLMGQGTTNLVAVPYMQETSITNAATTVAEAGTKPEATFALTQTSAPVKKIAVTIPVSDEAFEDVPTLQSYIDGRLRWMVETTEESELVSGDGTGSHLTGILNTSGIQTQAKGGDTAVDAIRKAKNLKVRAIGFAEPTGIVMHPTDWDAIQGLKDANNQYYGGGPFTGSYGTVFQMVDRVWGLPAVVTTGITQGTALLGAFRTDAMIFRKKGITIDSTNSHASEFATNIVRLRAEERLGLAVFRPKSFCQVTGL